MPLGSGPKGFPPPRLGQPGTKPARTGPDDSALEAWQKAKGGLFWVLFALFWFTLLGAVPFGKLAYTRWVEELPTGTGWVKFDGYVNSEGANAIQINKREELDLLLFGTPILLGGLALVYGRLKTSAVTRNSGGKGLIFLSALATLIGLVGYAAPPILDRVGYGDWTGYARSAMWCGLGLSEIWFAIGVAAVCATLRRPGGARAVGRYAIVLALGVVLATNGWEPYTQNRARILSSIPEADWPLWEEGAKLLGWLLVVFVAWGAVQGGRAAISDYLESPRPLPE